MFEPGTYHNALYLLGTFPKGSLCFVGEDEWCAVIMPEGEFKTQDLDRYTRIMIGGDPTLTHYVSPVLNSQNPEYVWCLITGLGIGLMSYYAHVQKVV